MALELALGEQPPGLPTLEEQIAEGRRFFVELDVPGVERCPVDFGNTADPVLFFASWAFAVRFGGMHELAQAAMHIERRHKIKLRPLLRYADRNVDDEADRQELERVWQPASELAECARALVTALRSGDAKLDELMTGHETVADRLDDLARMCEWGAAHDARVRLSFDMSHDQPTAPRPDASAHGTFLGPPGDAQRAERDAPAMTSAREWGIEREERAAAVRVIQAYFERERGETLGELGAGLFLDFIAEELGHMFYNRALLDAQAVAARHADSLEADLDAQRRLPPRGWVVREGPRASAD